MFEPSGNLASDVSVNRTARIMDASASEDVHSQRTFRQRREGFEVRLHPPTVEHLAEDMSVIFEDFVAH